MKFVQSLLLSCIIVSSAVQAESTPPLMKKADQAKEKAFIPGARSAFKVGAIIELEDGTLIEGANVKLPCGMTMCAERVALYKALTDGKKNPKIKAIYIENHMGKKSFPCGICRQALVLFSHAKTKVFFRNETGKVQEVLLSTLIPTPFRGTHFKN